jgi:hypothetical protein
VSGTVGSASNT